MDLNAALQDLARNSAPPWVDWILATAMWACGLLNLYLGALRINQSHGPFLACIRVLALAWLAYAARLTWWLVVVGEMPLSWWATVPLLVIAAGTSLLCVERIRMGRVRYGRRRNDRPI